ncbi:MAG TPA: hypothetical protein VGR81_04830 [Candidatus Acidoferrales bacterium]|nr:hypothetical protein [Candidatus Acidoferrales bacterium]
MQSILAHRPWQFFFISVFFLFDVFAFCAPPPSPQSSQASKAPQTAQTAQTSPAVTIPKVDGGAGSCKASFTVRDGSNKPIYNAQILVELRYGFMNLRKTDLQVGTNSDGKALITGLPDFPKKPLAFTIKSGTVSKTVTDDPAVNCNQNFDVVLTVH